MSRPGVAWGLATASLVLLLRQQEQVQFVPNSKKGWVQHEWAGTLVRVVDSQSQYLSPTELSSVTQDKIQETLWKRPLIPKEAPSEDVSWSENVQINAIHSYPKSLPKLSRHFVHTHTHTHRQINTADGDLDYIIFICIIYRYLYTFATHAGLVHGAAHLECQIHSVNGHVSAKFH